MHQTREPGANEPLHHTLSFVHYAARIQKDLRYGAVTRLGTTYACSEMCDGFPL